MSKKQTTFEFVNQVYLENELSIKNLNDCELLAQDAKIDISPICYPAHFNQANWSPVCHFVRLLVTDCLLNFSVRYSPALMAASSVLLANSVQQMGKLLNVFI